MMRPVGCMLPLLLIMFLPIVFATCKLFNEAFCTCGRQPLFIWRSVHMLALARPEPMFSFLAFEPMTEFGELG